MPNQHATQHRQEAPPATAFQAQAHAPRGMAHARCCHARQVVFAGWPWGLTVPAFVQNAGRSATRPARQVALPPPHTRAEAPCHWCAARWPDGVRSHPAPCASPRGRLACRAAQYGENGERGRNLEVRFRRAACRPCHFGHSATRAVQGHGGGLKTATVTRPRPSGTRAPPPSSDHCCQAAHRFLRADLAGGAAAAGTWPRQQLRVWLPQGGDWACCGVAGRPRAAACCQSGPQGSRPMVPARRVLLAASRPRGCHHPAFIPSLSCSRLRATTTARTLRGAVSF